MLWSLQVITATSTMEHASTALLDNGMFIHRVDGQQPIEYSIEGLKYEKLLRERGSETALQKT